MHVDLKESKDTIARYKEMSEAQLESISELNKRVLDYEHRLAELTEDFESTRLNAQFETDKLEKTIGTMREEIRVRFS